MSLLSIFSRRPSQPGLLGLPNRYPVLVSAAVIAVAVLCIFRAFNSGRTTEERYYTTDDDATFFTLSARIPPFDYHGHEAVGAMIFSCDGGKTRFVGYLYRFPPDVKAKAEEVMKQHGGGPVFGMEVKRAGTGAWVSTMHHGAPRETEAETETGASITNVKCPDGNGVPFMMNP